MDCFALCQLIEPHILRFYAFNLCCWEASGGRLVKYFYAKYVINLKKMATEFPTQGVVVYTIYAIVFFNLLILFSLKTTNTRIFG
jgi:hypothetical protein